MCLGSFFELQKDVRLLFFLLGIYLSGRCVLRSGGNRAAHQVEVHVPLKSDSHDDIVNVLNTNEPWGMTMSNT